MTGGEGGAGEQAALLGVEPGRDRLRPRTRQQALDGVAVVVDVPSQLERAVALTPGPAARQGVQLVAGLLGDPEPRGLGGGECPQRHAQGG